MYQYWMFSRHGNNITHTLTGWQWIGGQSQRAPKVITSLSTHTTFVIYNAAFASITIIVEWMDLSYFRFNYIESPLLDVYPYKCKVIKWFISFPRRALSEMHSESAEETYWPRQFFSIEKYLFYTMKWGYLNEALFMKNLNI